MWCGEWGYEMYSIVIPRNVMPVPNKNEMSAAAILLDYFKTNIEFIPRTNSKSPDLFIDGIEWELKTPVGGGKRNIQHVLSRAVKQSRYIIIDARFSKIHITRIKSRLSVEMKNNKQIRRLILIDKQKNVVEICR